MSLFSKPVNTKKAYTQFVFVGMPKITFKEKLIRHIIRWDRAIPNNWYYKSKFFKKVVTPIRMPIYKDKMVGCIFYDKALPRYQSFFYYRGTSFFLLTPSPWPFFASMASFIMLVGAVSWLNYYLWGSATFIFGGLLVFFAFVMWCRDLVRELVFLERYSKLVKINLRWGFWLFIISEALLFFSFFWAFFHSALEPTIQLGTVWPPMESIQMNNLHVPMGNTAFLLLSGAALTWMQYGLIAGIFFEVFCGFFFTFMFAIFFMISQWHEYIIAFHQVNDSVFGSTMYVLTAFHGMHVIVGTIFLAVCLIRFLLGHFETTNFLGVTLAAWYWHFVDIIWIAVYSGVYLWGTWIPKNAEIVFQSNFYQN